MEVYNMRRIMPKEKRDDRRGGDSDRTQEKQCAGRLPTSSRPMCSDDVKDILRRSETKKPEASERQRFP
jgi:hypothetical protein